MNEPLPHYINIAKKLASYGIDASEPMMFILGGSVVTAEIEARRALERLTTVIASATATEATLDDFDGDELHDAADLLAAFHRARRELFKAADAQGLRQRATA